MMSWFFGPNIKKLKAQGDIQGLTRALAHKKSEVREDAVSALRDIGGVQVVQPLIIALRDVYSSVRWTAIDTLGEIGDTQATRPLCTMLQNGDNYDRERASKALGKIGDARAVEPLIAAFKDGDEYVRKRVYEALRKINDPRADAALREVAALRQIETAPRTEQMRSKRQAPKISNGNCDTCGAKILEDTGYLLTTKDVTTSVNYWRQYSLS
jgi:HEAT repeat protein